MPRGRTLRLATLASLGGLYSGLFGVGSGSIVVPLLILWFGYEEREATGTSLAAILVIAPIGAALHGGIYGNVDIAKGLLVGLPAVAGVIVGTALQQRVTSRAIGLAFSVFLVGIAVELVIP